MGKLRISRSSFRASREVDIRSRLKISKQKSEHHPIESAGILSIATFSWMSRLMYSSYKRPLDLADIPMLPEKETCRINTDALELLWAKEVALKTPPRFGRVLWQCVKKHILLTTCVFLVTIILGFCSSVILLKRVLDYASDPDGRLLDGAIRVSLLILCEFLRVFFFTLTWALSYRTAIRLKTACMGLVYRKLLRLSSTNDKHSAKILNLILTDCHRIYEVVVNTQVAIGGPITLVLGAIYITYELGFISLIGMLVFPASYPVQYLLAKGSASLKRKALNYKDTRIMLLTQSIQNLKFLKMFGWEKHFGRLITETRQSERLKLLHSQILTSFSIVLSPMLPHVGAITTFILYISMGNELTPAQAFSVVTLYAGRIRPTLNAVRMGIRAYVNSLISIQRIQAFTTLFLFSLFAYATRTISRLLELKHSMVITLRRIEEVISLPEVSTRVPYFLQNDTEDSILIENLSVERRIRANELEKVKKKKKLGKKNKDKTTEPGSFEQLMGSDESDFLTFQLENINVTIKRGSFIGVCGHVGSGKSTFLEAIAGAISHDKGQLNVYGKTAYVPQEPWIFQGTLRDNIQFGEVFDPVRYYSVINSCCLVNDFGNLGQGDLTETSDNGSNISGGQRQRLSLARALYHLPVRDIYLLDDPLSGLDDRVANTIYEKVIVEQLRKEKTVVFATHQLQFLRDCDEILVFSEGRIVERGRHQDLIVYPNSQYATLVHASPTTNDSTEELSLEDSNMLDCSSNFGPTEKVSYGNEDSSNNDGKMPWQAYGMYIKSSGGPIAVVLVLLAFALNIGSTAFSSWWLKNWFRASTANATNFENGSNVNSTFAPFSKNHPWTTTPDIVITMDTPEFPWYRDIYAGIIGVIFLTSVLRTVLFSFATLRAAQNIHQDLLVHFFKGRLKSIEWFGTGEVLQIFTRDMGEVDGGLPNSMEFLLQNIFLVVSILIVVSMIFPMFLIPLVLLFGIFLLVRKIYNVAIRDLKRFESDSKTPIYTRVTETVAGMGTIRAFGKEQQLINGHPCVTQICEPYFCMNQFEFPNGTYHVCSPLNGLQTCFEELTDWNNSVYYIFVSAMRWLAFRLDALAVSVTATTAVFVLLFSGTVSPASCGLALSYAAQLSGIFQFTVRMASEVEAKFVCVERMNDFLTTTQTEEAKTNSEFPSNNEDSGGSHLMSHPNWPFSGKLKFHDAVLSYTSEAEPALKNLTVEITPGSKIGIVGRTGSGKSSIGNALFRLMELKSGYIYLDDVDIAGVPLQKLRNSLCVIPQDAAIFHKSARFNLDPGNVHLDSELWAVLEKVGLKPSIESLDAEVGLSQGQKQMLSIARAILRQSKVVFIDEATSNVDAETAALMDQVIMEEFSMSTVFIVAHRLQALKYCDYLLVMEDGELRDFGPLDVIGKKPEFLTHFEKFDTIPLE